MNELTPAQKDWLQVAAYKTTFTAERLPSLVDLETLGLIEHKGSQWQITAKGLEVVDANS